MIYCIQQASKDKMTTYIMGIDIGTTSVKVCLINSISREVLHKNIKVKSSDIPFQVFHLFLELCKLTPEY